MTRRIVVDTNIFISALLSPRGDNRQVIRACLRGAAVPLMGSALFHEYEDLLARSELMRKSPLPAGDRQALFEAFLAVAEWVKIYFLWRPNLPDEADNHLVELAVAGAASAIVTNNITDLRQGQLAFSDLHILKPAEFLKTISWPP